MSKQSLKIAHVTLNYKPYSGGVVSSLTSLTTELINQGHQPTIITLDFTGHDEPEAHVKRLKCRWHFRYKKNPITIPISPYKQLLALLQAIQPDIVHLHHPFILGPSAAKAAKQCGIPTVFTHHSLYEQYAHYIPLPTTIVRFIGKRLVKKFCTDVDHIIAPSGSIKNYIRERNVTTPISIIPSAISPLFIQALPQQKTELGSRPIHLLTVSRFAPEKNIMWLLDAYHKLIGTSHHQFTLTLVGYGAWKDQLQNYAHQQLGLDPSPVQFIERPTKEILLKHYQEADFFVFASQSETQGLVMAEAMSQATPVIALSGPGTNDIIRSGFNGFIVESSAEFVEKINNIASDQSLFVALQQGASITAREYHPSHLTNNMIKLYEHLLTKP